MEYKYSKEYVGNIFITNEGYDATVVDGGTFIGCVTIKIKDLVFEVKTSNLKKGNVKYPYHMSVYGVGYVGVGFYKPRLNNRKAPEYTRWINMLRRCYSLSDQEKHPTYIGCSVDPRWHDFQAFAEWHEKNYKEVGGVRFELDKDLLIDGNKVYSPENCIFLPKKINTFLSNKQSSNKSGVIGVSWDKEHEKWRAQCHDFLTDKILNLGRYYSTCEASDAYIKSRKIQCENAKQYMRDLGIYSEDVIQKIN